MTTPLDKPLRREVTVDGARYTLTIDPDGFRLVEKGRRNGHALQWKDILNGDAALAQGLYASLMATPAVKSAARTNAKRSARRPAPAATIRSAAPVARRPSHRRRRSS